MSDVCAQSDHTDENKSQRGAPPFLKDRVKRTEEDAIQFSLEKKGERNFLLSLFSAVPSQLKGASVLVIVNISAIKGQIAAKCSVKMEEV